MRRLALFLAIAALTVPPGSFSAPPPGLTVYGRTIYNLDALVFDVYRGRPYCYRSFQTEKNNVGAVTAFTVYCVNVPNVDRIPFKPTFASARKSAFKLLHMPNAITELYKKPTISSAQLSRVERQLGNHGALIWLVYDAVRQYVAVISCGNGRYLISGNAGIECFRA